MATFSAIYDAGMHNLSNAERLQSLQIYSLQRRRDRYMAIYMWKILERSAQLLATHSVPYMIYQIAGVYCAAVV